MNIMEGPVTVRFVRFGETGGTFKYREVRSDGHNAQRPNLLIGTLYLQRCATDPAKRPPRVLEATVEVIG